MEELTVNKGPAKRHAVDCTFQNEDSIRISQRALRSAFPLFTMLSRAFFLSKKTCRRLIPLLDESDGDFSLLTSPRQAQRSAIAPPFALARRNARSQACRKKSISARRTWSGRTFRCACTCAASRVLQTRSRKSSTRTLTRWRSISRSTISCGNTKTLSMSPAMAAGIADRLWSIEDIVALIDGNEGEPKKRGPYKNKTSA